MSDNNLWYGYLEAGSKSSPVLMDRRLNTGDSNTLYLFNLNRGEILEYKREIIEPKLRELSADEQKLCVELKSAFGKARVGFIPRGNRSASLSEPGPVQSAVKQAANDENEDELDAILDPELDEEWEEEEA